MTTLAEVQIQCPVCSRFFKTETVTSTNQVGMHSDFKPVVAGVFPYSFYVITCPSCGFSGYEDDFSQNYPAPFKEKVRTELTGKVAGKRLFGSEKYLLAAWCAEVLKQKKYEIADLYLRASWCAQDETNEENEKSAQEKASALLEKALSSGEITDKGRASVTYLVGELKRRLGKTEDAAKWFDKVKSEIVDEKEQAGILAAAKQQKRSPKNTMPETLL